MLACERAIEERPNIFGEYDGEETTMDKSAVTRADFCARIEPEDSVCPQN